MKMTRAFFYALFVMTVLMTGCGDDDDNGFSLAGVWTLTQESTSGCNDPLDNGVENEVCTATDCETLTIDGSGGFTVTEIDNGVTTSFSGTYTTNGNTITFTYTINNVTDTDRATFTVNGSTLVLTFDVDSDGCVDAETYSRN